VNIITTKEQYVKSVGRRIPYLLGYV